MFSKFHPKIFSKFDFLRKREKSPQRQKLGVWS
jgi:hypothetical protein